MDLHIIPECYIDTKLIKALVPPSTRYNHQKGCSTVAKVMQEKFDGDFAVGIIDRDKQELGYAQNFELVFEIQNQLQLFKHPAKHHFLIFICPAIEKWMLLNAVESDFSLEKFGLPSDLKQLTKITKSSKSEENDQFSSNFKQLFKEFKQNPTKQIQTLIFWIEYLKQNPYSSDTEFIIFKTKEILSS